MPPFLPLFVKDPLGRFSGLLERFLIAFFQFLQMARQVLLHGEQRLGSHLELAPVLPVGKPPVKPRPVALPLLWQHIDQKSILLFPVGIVGGTVHLHVPFLRGSEVEGHNLLKSQEQNLPVLGTLPQILWLFS